MLGVGQRACEGLLTPQVRGQAICRALSGNHCCCRRNRHRHRHRHRHRRRRRRRRRRRCDRRHCHRRRRRRRQRLPLVLGFSVFLHGFPFVILY